jgi:hypothetical protein
MADLSARRLRDMRVQAATAVLLFRKVTPHLVKAFFESLAIGERVRNRVSPPKRRAGRPLKIGVFAVGAAASGVAAARLARHHGPFRDDTPELDRS